MRLSKKRVPLLDILWQSDYLNCDRRQAGGVSRSIVNCNLIDPRLRAEARELIIQVTKRLMLETMTKTMMRAVWTMRTMWVPVALLAPTFQPEAESTRGHARDIPRRKPAFSFTLPVIAKRKRRIPAPDGPRDM